MTVPGSAPVPAPDPVLEVFEFSVEVDENHKGSLKFGISHLKSLVGVFLLLFGVLDGVSLCVGTNRNKPKGCN